MSDVLKTILVLLLIFVIAVVIYMIAIVAIEVIKARRIQINENLRSENKRLREENGMLRDRNIGVEAERRVHNETVARYESRVRELETENESLETEIRMLMDGTPAYTIRGMRFVRVG